MASGTGLGDEEFDINKIRYHKIIIMTDADVDGSHIRTLLLTFFFRHMPQLVDRGYLYIAQPPLYKVTHRKKETYIANDDQLENFINEIGGRNGVSINRYKGLGEMNPEQRWESTLDPNTRNIRQVTTHHLEDAHRVFSTLMGDEVEPRRQFIYDNALSVANLDI